MIPPSRARAVLRLAATAIALLALLGAGEPQDAKREAERLRFENEILEKKAELASGDAFYVILDPGARTLSLMLKGAVLRRLEVSGLEVGDRRVAFVPRGDALLWQGRVWSGGSLVPPREQDRVEIKAPPPGMDEASAPEPPVPPTPEEKYPVPPRYGIRYTGGLYLEILPLGETVPSKGLGNRLQDWWDDAKEAMSSEPTDRLRLRVSLKHEDSEALYRSLPPGTKLLVLPPSK